ncbi:MAG: transcription termination/antitermination NusG family protein [Anaerolineae bacterium]|nr:transcription termination/antitermination NusG family protein [Anaerolineae bacterium]
MMNTEPLEPANAVENGAAETKSWYAVYTHPHKEYMVRSVLQANGVEVYLPEIAMVYQRRDRRAMKPFFPQYMFARFTPHGDDMAQARWTPGVRGLVSSGGQPTPVPDQVVEYIRQRLKDMVSRDIPDVPFKKGEVVQVARGPLEGLEGIFDSARSPGDRVIVLLAVMDRLVRTELDLADLISP